MEETKTTVYTITAKIYSGLREGHSEEEYTVEEVYDVLQEYMDKEGLCVTITPTEFLLNIKMEQQC